jgi:hypothetical protein
VAVSWQSNTTNDQNNVEISVVATSQAFQPHLKTARLAKGTSLDHAFKPIPQRSSRQFSLAAVVELKRLDRDRHHKL